jgi:hypothetical protein
MDELHSAIMKAFTENLNPIPLAVALIRRKAAEQGLVFSKRHLNKIESCLRGQTVPNFVVRMPGSGPAREFKLELNESDVQEVENQLQSLLGKLPGMMLSLCDVVAEDLVTTLLRTWPPEARLRQREEHQFHGSLRRKWDVPIQLLEVLIAIATEVGGTMNDELRAEGDAQTANTVEVLTRLHARACQVASEIRTLLCCGFADGALTRWRTLHEISVLASFVQAHGEAAAECFLAYRPIEHLKAAEEFQFSCRALGYDPLTQQELDTISKDAEIAKRRFGRQSSRDYGWAAPFLAEGREPTFRALQESVGLRHLRPFYKMASDNVHASAKGLGFALGLESDSGLLLAGPSDVGLADPGQLTAVSLAHITTVLLGVKLTLDSGIWSKVLVRLAGDIADAFCSVEPEVQ